jgi:hypothetical protein
MGTLKKKLLLKSVYKNDADEEAIDTRKVTRNNLLRSHPDTNVSIANARSFSTSLKSKKTATKNKNPNRCNNIKKKLKPI